MILGLASKIEVVGSRFEVPVPDEVQLQENFNIHPDDDCLFLSSQKPNEFIQMKYGMVPFWSKNETIYYNAPYEGKSSPESGKFGIVADPAFRKPIREQRGILPVSYFVIKSTSGIPFLIYPKDKSSRPVGLACVWDCWKKEILDELTYGFAIITISSYGKFRRAGINRLPMLINPYKYKRWLRSDQPLIELAKMMDLCPENLYDAFPISTDILQSKENDKSLITATGDIIERPVPKIPEPTTSKRRKGDGYNGLTLGERMKF